ncbi:MAG: hypothetical protein EBS71_04390, partial [Actinobacteria bacterium]|nr:hypothetical protein [Actinomycetota bacterium]
MISEPERDESLSITAFLTNTFLAWLDGRGPGEVGAAARPGNTPWFAHLSYLRPHPPYTAAGRCNRHVDRRRVVGAGPPA